MEVIIIVRFEPRRNEEGYGVMRNEEREGKKKVRRKRRKVGVGERELL